MADAPTISSRMRKWLWMATLLVGIVGGLITAGILLGRPGSDERTNTLLVGLVPYAVVILIGLFSSRSVFSAIVCTTTAVLVTLIGLLVLTGQTGNSLFLALTFQSIALVISLAVLNSTGLIRRFWKKKPT